MSENIPKIIEITGSNIDTSHICCAIGETPDALACAGAKKAWMRTAFKTGYRFFRADARGKAFIETVPAQNAFCPITANGWTFIACFWVSGSLKGRGLGTRLLQKAIDEAKASGSRGVVALSADKKRPFLSDPRFYTRAGFSVCDEAPPFYRLIALPFGDDTPLPPFNKSTKNPRENTPGIAIYYADACPHPSKYLPLLQAACQKRGVPFTARKIETPKQAQAAPNPFPTWAMFYGGAFVTNEIFSEGKLMKFLDENLPLNS